MLDKKSAGQKWPLLLLTCGQVAFFRGELLDLVRPRPEELREGVAHGLQAISRLIL